MLADWVCVWRGLALPCWPRAHHWQLLTRNISPASFSRALPAAAAGWIARTCSVRWASSQWTRAPSEHQQPANSPALICSLLGTTYVFLFTLAACSRQRRRKR
jgi:hypothetical protein